MSAVYLKKLEPTKYAKISSEMASVFIDRGWFVVTQEEYEAVNADALPVLPGSPLDELSPDAPTTPAPAQPAAGEAVITERLENYRAIFHDVIGGHLQSTPEVMAQHALYVMEQYDLERLAHQVNAERANDFEAELATLQAKLSAAEAANTRLRESLEPFAEAWPQIPFGLLGDLIAVRHGFSYITCDSGLDTTNLEDAHTAYYNLPTSDQSAK